MMLGLPLAFTAPVLLAALVGLPALWYLLRLTPPPPKLSPLPTLPLIKDLVAEEQRPTRTPWWLLLLRCLIAALIILAMAGPVWNPNPVAVSVRNGPLVVALDDGWSSALDWRERAAFAERSISAAPNLTGAQVTPGLPRSWPLHRMRRRLSSVTV
jgi:Aerotolerance regulator N-terminal